MKQPPLWLLRTAMVCNAFLLGHFYARGEALYASIAGAMTLLMLLCVIARMESEGRE